MGMSGGKAPKQKESQAERMQAERAQSRLQEWKSDGFKDLETSAIRDARTDLTEALERRGNADAVQSIAPDEAGRQVSMSQGNLGKQLFSENLGLDGAIREVDRNSRIEAATMRDQKMIGMAKVGQNVAATVDNAFTNAASRGASAARTRAENQAALRNEKLNRIMGVVQGAASGYAMRQGPSTKQNVATDSGIMLQGRSPGVMTPQTQQPPAISTGNYGYTNPAQLYGGR